jgi:galactan 5-O-arabinofuranosyltransferase
LRRGQDGRRRRAWPFLEAALVLVAAAIAAPIAHAFVVALHFDARSRTAPGLGPIWAAAMVAIACGAQFVQLRSKSAERARIVVALLAGVAITLVALPLLAGLHGTDLPPNGVLGGDMAFRTESVTRFASTWHLDDYTFRGLHAFYPPAWFWLAGRAAHVFGVAPWQMLKPFTIGTVGAALALAYALWRVVLTPAGALSAAIGSSLVLPAQLGSTNLSTQAWYSAYSCFVAVTGVAWLAATAATIRRGGDSRLRLVLLALVGALLALCYYLLFVLLVVVLIALVLGPRVGRREALPRVAAVLGGVGLLTAPFWLSLVSGILGGAASQGHFVRPDFLQVSVGVGGSRALAVLAVAVAGMLALTFAAQASRAVTAVILGAVLYQLFSVATLVIADTQLQPHRAVTLMWAAMGAAGAVAVDRLRDPGTRTRLAAPGMRWVAGALVALTVAGTFAVGSSQGTDLAAGPYTQAAHRRPDLTNTTAESRFIKQTTGKPPDQLTVLSVDDPLVVLEPYYGFLALRARYAHPQARLPERIAVLRAAAACHDSACAQRTLEGSQFGRIDAMVLTRTRAGYRVVAQEDGFPGPKAFTIVFRRRLFSPALWASRSIGHNIVLVRRPGA